MHLSQANSRAVVQKEQFFTVEIHHHGPRCLCRRRLGRRRVLPHVASPRGLPHLRRQRVRRRRRRAEARLLSRQGGIGGGGGRRHPVREAPHPRLSPVRRFVPGSCAGIPLQPIPAEALRVGVVTLRRNREGPLRHAHTDTHPVLACRLRGQVDGVPKTSV